MQILHISAECYPAAKAGGLGDVAGALPKYLNELGLHSAVVIPKYRTPWLEAQQYERVYLDYVRLHEQILPIAVERVRSAELGFDLYVVDIPGRYDRPGVYINPDTGYAYDDAVERSLAFQKAVLQWIMSMPERPGVLHCHDHHTGLIPFFITKCPEYESLQSTPTVFTIHNGQYHGAFSWDKSVMFPTFDVTDRGLLDWNGEVNPLATAIKTCWRLTTVSPTYLLELQTNSNGLENLLRLEAQKSKGILNGIDVAVWNPSTDNYLSQHLEDDEVEAFKKASKKLLLKRFNIKLDLPIITFIGRLVGEKGADLLPDVLLSSFHKDMPVSFIVLGTGDPKLEERFRWLQHSLPGFFDISLEYNEQLAHQLYAGSDFLLMPSRVEPCGLNQMYAMRYGTIPIVRTVGGLKDTVPDIGEPDGSGRGIRFDQFTVEDAVTACQRAADLYADTAAFRQIRSQIMEVDFSWEQAARQYASLYSDLG